MILPASLARARRRGGFLRPARANVGDEELLLTASELIDLFAEAAAGRWSRGRLDASVLELASEQDRKVVLGIAHVLSQSIVEAPAVEGVNSVAFRKEVFETASAFRPIALERGPFERTVADDVLASVGEKYGLDGPTARHALYADLPSEHVVHSFEVPEVGVVLSAYDLALAQTPLVRATKMTVTLQSPSTTRIRQLLRHARFRQLIHQAKRDGERLIIEFDGPMSLFGQTTRYGVAFANFLPALFLQTEAWSLEAQVRWPPGTATFRIDHTDGFVAHLPDHGAWKTRFHTWFEERWAAKDTGPWRLSEHTTPLNLAGLGVLLPDYEITDGSRTALLEILGYWNKDALLRRVETLQRAGPGNLILAVSRRLCTSENGVDDWPAIVVPFSEVVSVSAVLAAVELAARPAPST